MFIYKTAKFSPVCITILKIRAILYNKPLLNMLFAASHTRKSQSLNWIKTGNPGKESHKEKFNKSQKTLKCSIMHCISCFNPIHTGLFGWCSTGGRGGGEGRVFHLHPVTPLSLKSDNSNFVQNYSGVRKTTFPYYLTNT